MENSNKISQQIIYLNSNWGGNWSAVPGYFSLANATQFNKYANTANFDLNRGYVLKVFYNTITGEVKFFPASLFEY